MRIFSDIKYRLGPDSNGLYTLQTVPILYGDASSLVAQLITGASQNTLLPSPMFSAYIYDISMSPERRAATQYVGTASTIERKFNKQTQQYEDEVGVRISVDRYMPVPYDITMYLDLWTTNTTTKLQILEQIMMIFNPSLQLQQNSNILDWTSIFEVWMTDMTWTNRQVPQGADDTRDVMTLQFKVEVWINPPAKLKRSGLVAEIVTRVFNVDPNTVETKNEYDPFSCLGDVPLQIVTTPGNYKILVAKGIGSDIITLLTQNGEIDTTLSWSNLFQKYGQITPNITKIRLKLDPDLDVDTSDIIGGIVISPTNQNQLLFTPDLDTLPTNTILPIYSIIDPTEITPGNGLPAAVTGQRYLLTSNDSTGEEPAIPPNVPTTPWSQNLVAYPNDIIEYNGVNWIVIFSSRNATGKNYVINNENGSQYTFDADTNKMWTYTYYGQYAAGYWRVDNIISCPNGITINSYE